MEETYRLEETLGYLASRTNLLMRNLFTTVARAEGLEATVEQMGLLYIIFHHPGATQAEIADAGGKDRTGVTRMLDLLEKKNAVERRPDEQDRRAYRIYITPLGEETLHRLVKIARQVNELSCAGLKPEEVQGLKSLLRRVDANLEKAMGE